MSRFATVFAIAALACAAAPAMAADDPQLQGLATCRDSWFEWKDDAAKVTQFGQFIHTRFTPAEAAGFKPKAPTSVLGFPVVEVFPQSIGMAVGFSVLVDGSGDKVRAVFEKQIGHAMTCEASDGMKSCEYKIAERKSASLLSDDSSHDSSHDKTTLIGCYYFYEK